jgi:hypothetical protein
MVQCESNSYVYSRRREIMRRFLRIMLISLFVFLVLLSKGYSADYKELIVGKWLIYERTSKAFDHNSSFVKAPWYVSYEFKKNGKVVITVKNEVEEPYPYRIKGNTLIINKYGMEGEWEIIELTNDKLILKSPGYINRYKRKR